jgi:LmbE family N-acetylglucosaminyl deacetylase
MPDKKMLIFVAHADDTEFLAGGTVAKFAAEGWEIVEVIATNNERGSFELDRETLIRDSEKEALAAARILGKKDVIFLGYPDGNLGDTPINVLREKFIRLLRQHRPQLVMTFDPWAPFEPHPDHRAVAWAAVEAIFFSHLPLFHPEHLKQGLKPHLVAEVYYFAKESNLVNKAVDITAFVDKKIEALCAHDSQMKLTIDDLKLALEALGAKPELSAGLDRNNYQGLLALMVKAWFGEVGKKHGFAFAEEFRTERAGGPIAAAVMGS